MAKWGTYPPDEQLRLKRDAAEELYDVVERILDRGYVSECIEEERGDHLALKAALAKARGEAA